MTSPFSTQSETAAEYRETEPLAVTRSLTTTFLRLIGTSILIPALSLILLASFAKVTAGQWNILIGATVVGIAGASVAFWLVRQRVIVPLRKTTQALAAVVEGDFSVSASVTDRGEIGALASGVNHLARSLRNIVDQTRTIAEGNYSAEIAPRNSNDELGTALYEMTETLRRMAAICESVAIGDYSIDVPIKGDKDLLGHALNHMIENLRNVTEQISLTGAQLVIASKEQSEGARNQSVATEEMTTTVSELLVSARNVSENAANVAEQAERGAQECGEGSQSVENAARGIKGIYGRVEEIARLMLDLDTKSQQISSVLDIIIELSEQTNLLSLNASIEAAGAGEAGKRFAVVAGEIRKLAERAGDSSDEIRSLVQGIQEMVNTTIVATEQGTKAVQEGVHLIEEVDQSFERIAAQVASTAESAKVIEMGSRQQATAIAEMQEAVKNVDTAAQEATTTAAQVNKEAQSLLECVRGFRSGTDRSQRNPVAESGFGLALRPEHAELAAIGV